MNEDRGDETTRLINRPRDERIRQRPRVTWTDSAGTHSITLDQRSLVGSASGARLVIADPTVSRLHAEFQPRDDGVWVQDLGSRNGTFVEGVQVGSARVPPGGSIRLGETTLTLAREPVPEVVHLWPANEFGRLLGESSAMRELFAQLARIAPASSSVLIHGETGTGKELVARALHDASPRAKQPFVIIDCAALPEQLLESELFGHVRGAFTGAVATRAGAIEAADEGTVFLDEIGELPLAMQPKLLRVLESRTVRRVGETTARKVDVRFVSATHRDLRTMVNAGAFREDLYFRLAVLPVVVPPLRDHSSDIPLLVQRFLPPTSPPLGRETMQLLVSRPWLGNVRELRNFVERVVALGAREALALEDGSRPTISSPSISAPVSIAAPAAADSDDAPRAPDLSFDRPFKEVREDWLDHLEREYVRWLLTKYNRNIAAAAQAAAIDRTYIYRLIRKHRL
jgi:two-component system response regulator GlrR